MKKILFLHGFFATGSCPMARALKEAFEETAVVLTPDLPLHPKEALKEIRFIIDREQPDLLLGNSCGSFLAQKMMMDFSAKEERFSSISRAANISSPILPSTPRPRSAWWFIRLSMETKPIGFARKTCSSGK